MAAPAVPHLIWMREEEIWLSSSLRASAWEDFLVLEWVGWSGQKKPKHKTKERMERPIALVQALERPPSALLTGFPECDLLSWVSGTGRATGERTQTPGESVLTTVLER